MSVVPSLQVGHWYRAPCPTCHSNVSFDCRSRAVYGIECSVCRTVVDLRNPDIPLPPGDTGVMSDGAAVPHFSPAVCETNGPTAEEQLAMFFTRAAMEEQKELPNTVGGEAAQALLARRLQAVSERFAFLNPVVHGLEYVVFGTRPIARIGHIRIFKKSLPIFGTVYIPVPKTSTSYATPIVFTVFLFTMWSWGCFVLDTPFLWRAQKLECLTIVMYLVLMFRVVYMDPGFVRPAYLTADPGRTDVLTIKDIEEKERPSQWEVINGEQVECKWCSTCELYRPPRAAHCYHCGMCVMNHDHHCTVIGACVGIRNVEPFTGFTSLVTWAAFIPSASLFYELQVTTKQLTPVTFGCLVVVILLFATIAVSICGLSVMMISGIMMETTSRERMHDAFKKKRNPFNRGIMGNLYQHVCSRNSPSIFDEEFVRLCAGRVV